MYSQIATLHCKSPVKSTYQADAGTQICMVCTGYKAYCFVAHHCPQPPVLTLLRFARRNGRPPGFGTHLCTGAGAIFGTGDGLPSRRPSPCVSHTCYVRWRVLGLCAYDFRRLFFLFYHLIIVSKLCTI